MFYKVTIGLSNVISHYESIEDMKCEFDPMIFHVIKEHLLSTGVFISDKYTYISDAFSDKVKIHCMKIYKRNLKINDILR